mmetsp:Transcript_30948/g.68545  ORF Transcript_30948/g.68545 Transcript_30948/m.68545 type:complete len:261 (+) Transcript_30948:1424-2206(+)
MASSWCNRALSLMFSPSMSISLDRNASFALLNSSTDSGPLLPTRPDPLGSSRNDLVDCVRDSSAGALLLLSLSCTAVTSFCSAAWCCAAWSSRSCSLGSITVTGGTPEEGAVGGRPSSPSLGPPASEVLRGGLPASLRLAMEEFLGMLVLFSITVKRPFFLGSRLVVSSGGAMLVDSVSSEGARSSLRPSSDVRVDCVTLPGCTGSIPPTTTGMDVVASPGMEEGPGRGPAVRDAEVGPPARGALGGAAGDMGGGSSLPS